MTKLSKLLIKNFVVFFMIILFFANFLTVLAQIKTAKTNAAELLESSTSIFEVNIKDSFQHNIIIRTRYISAICNLARDYLSRDFLASLSASLGFENIAVIDNQGRITSSYGKDYPENYNAFADQEIMSVISKLQSAGESMEDYSCIEETALKTAGSMFSGGFLYITYSKDRTKNLYDNTVKNFTMNQKIGKTGYAIIIDKNGKIISDVGSIERLGLPVTEIGFKKYNDINSLQQDKLYKDVIYEKPCFFTVEDFEHFRMIAVIPQEEAEELINRNVIFASIYEMLTFITIFLVTYIMLKKTIIRNLDKTDEKLSEITKGNLDVILEPSRIQEFNNLSKNINETVSSLKELTEKAQFQNKNKSLFLATMSHEIRTPMNAIVGMSELALDFNLPDNEKNTIRQIRTSSLNLVNIINDILDFSKIESGKLDIILNDYDLLKTLYDISNIILVRIKDKNVKLILQIDPELANYFHGDDMRIRQVLINLAGNSAKFTEKGSIIIRAESLHNYEDREGIRFSILDTGIGIKEEDLSKLFTNFTQVNMQANRKNEGTGLGLVISKKLINLMNGNFSIESEYGKGTSIYINLPQKIVDYKTCNQAYPSLFQKAEFDNIYTNLKNIPVVELLNQSEFSSLFVDHNISTQTFTAPEARILVVDDNDVNLQVAEGLLKKFDIIPVTALSGKKAIELTEKEDFHIIFMDHQMPEMDGIECMKIINDRDKKERNKIIIALSANAINSAKEMFLSNGFDDFLSKPVQGKDFANALRKWLPGKIIQENKIEEQSVFQIPEDFPSINHEIINLEQAINFSGDFENWLKAVKIFYNFIDEKSSEIENYLNSSDIKNFTTQVHALKTSSRIIGAERLSVLAEELEAKARELEKESSSLSSIKNKAEKMLDLYKSYKSHLENIFLYRKENKIEANEISSQTLNLLLNDILKDSQENNLNSLEDNLIKLKSFKLPGSIKSKIPDLEKAVENIDFEEVNKILEMII